MSAEVSGWKSAGPPVLAGEVRHPQIGPAGDRVAAQALVADQRQEVRVVDRAGRLVVALAVGAVAGGAGAGEDLEAALLVSAASSPRTEYGGRSVRDGSGRCSSGA